MMRDPVTGPISRTEFNEIVNAPFGEAVKRIRKHDPLWGRQPGEKFKWRVTVERTVTETGTAYVMAATEEEAKKLSDDMPDSKFDWEPTFFGADYDSLAVEPVR